VVLLFVVSGGAVVVTFVVTEQWYLFFSTDKPCKWLKRVGFTIRPEANENIGLIDRCGVYPFNVLTFLGAVFT